MLGMLPNIVVNAEAMRSAALAGFATATDLADYLVRRGVAFRDAHEAVGKAVAFAIANEVSLDQLELAQLQQFSSLIEADVFTVLELDGSVAARDHLGGTAPDQVRAAVKRARGNL
jgi:argininosuccinate lyase